MQETKTWEVYFLPNENYCGISSNLHRRLIQHRCYGKKNTDGCIVVATFKSKREALDFEKDYQLVNGTNGYCYTPEWRDKQRERNRDYLGEQLGKRVVCLNSGVKYLSVRECARTLKICQRNLGKHLKKHPEHSSVKGLKFEFL
jgi:hypothetical protein